MVFPRINNKKANTLRYNNSPSTSGCEHKGTSSKKDIEMGPSEDSFEYKKPVPVRIGEEYQAVCPELLPANMRETEADKALIAWTPSETISETKLEDYLVLAKEKYSYKNDQALGMLMWHHHDLDGATDDLANFRPFPDEFSEEEKAIFEQGIEFYGKDFHKICRMLPGKSIANLVQYYYSWKKTSKRFLNKRRAAKKRKASKKDKSTQ